MTLYGFKELSIQNWTEPDPIMAIFGTVRDDGTMSTLTGSDWTERFLTPKLKDHVPEELRRLFEVAKGITVYGFFFYPLCAVCMGEIFRVLDAATVWKCRLVKAPNLSTFQRRIDWLLAAGHIADKDRVRWNARRDLRNYTSHPSDHTLLPPGEAWQALVRAADEINQLFAPTGEGSGSSASDRSQP